MVTSKKHSSAKDNKPSRLTRKDKVSTVGGYGKSLVGSRIKVWWPIDRRFYKGVVESFDASRKRHRILYDDGDKENLDMKNERWGMIDEEEDDDDNADEVSLQEESDDDSSESDASPEPVNRKGAQINGNSSGKGRKDDAVLKKKQRIVSSAKSKSEARSGKKSEKSKDAKKQTLKPETERNGKLGDIGGKIVAAASRMGGRFLNIDKENGQAKEKKIHSSSSEAVSEKVKKTKDFLEKIQSNNSDGEDDADTSDDDSKPLVSLLKKSPEAMEALMEKLKGKKEKKKEAGEGSSGNEAEEEAVKEAVIEKLKGEKEVPEMKRKREKKSLSHSLAG